MADEKMCVDKFFNTLCYTVCNSDLDLTWDDEELEKLFAEITKLFSSKDDMEKIPWNMMWYSILNSKVYSDILEKKKVLKVDIYEEYYSDAGTVTLRRKLLMMDDVIEGGRFTWIMQSKYCGPDIRGKGSKDSNKRDLFEKLIDEVDVDGKIRKLFCHKEENQKREKWILNAIDAKEFYDDLNTVEGTVKEISFNEHKRIYERYCYENNWEKNYNRMCDLLKAFQKMKKKTQDTFFLYSFYDEIVEILSELLPVIEFSGKERRIKDYEQWMKERIEIAEIINEKCMQIKIDPYERMAYKLITELLAELETINEYKEKTDCVKDVYLNFIDTAYFDLKDRVHKINTIGRLESWENDDMQFIKDLILAIEV